MLRLHLTVKENDHPSNPAHEYATSPIGLQPVEYATLQNGLHVDAKLVGLILLSAFTTGSFMLYTWKQSKSGRKYLAQTVEKIFFPKGSSVSS